MTVQRKDMLQTEIDHLEHVEQLREWRRTGQRPVSDADLALAERLASLAVNNAELRLKSAAERHAKANTEAAAHKARTEQRLQAEQEAYMQRRRFQFRGTDAQWDAMKDRILESYLLGEAEAETPTPNPLYSSF